MDPVTWELTIITPGKIYKGLVTSRENLDRRTISLLNAQIRNPKFLINDRLYVDGYLRLENVQVSCSKHRESYDSICVNKADIIFAYDEFYTMGSKNKRTNSFHWENQSDRVFMTLLTTQKGGQHYRFMGNVHQPWFKFSGDDMFIPMTDVRIERFIAKRRTRSLQTIRAPFVGINRSFIEAYSTDGREY